MIFCEPSKVNAVWETVARATANGELGIAAKVAPRPEEAFQARTRLICVYTRDFRERRDVWRVLERLRELQLVETGKPLYYKPGEYTPLDTCTQASADVGRYFHVYWARLREPLGYESEHIQVLPMSST